MKATKLGFAGLVAAALVGGAFVACVGDDPTLGAVNTDQDAAPPDGPRTTDSASAADASDGAPACQEVCQDANTLRRCNPVGSATDVACAAGCVTAPAPHCKHLAPTGIAPAADFDTPGTAAVSLATTVVHSDTGEIEGVRTANADPTMMTVTAGIGFHAVTVGGNSVGVFVFDTLTITGTVKVTGLHPVVFLARGAVAINAINASGECAANKPGPGGYAGGTPGTPQGAGPGGGKAGMFNTLHGGGGGGAHGHQGGAGGSSGTGTGGAGGVAYGDVVMGTLRGGSGGGASAQGTRNGGAGGGAIQIVSEVSISMSNGIAACGCGGGGASDNTCGGGGAGGAILLEAPTISVVDNTGYLVAGGGGGGGSMSGNAAAASNLEVGSGVGGFCGGGRCGGQGGYSAHMDGKNGSLDGQTAGCGGGAAGRIRLNTQTGAATLGTTGTLYVPSVTATGAAGEAGFSQGIISFR